MSKLLSAWSPVTLILLRVMTGLLYMQHGTQKLFQFPDAGHNSGPVELLSVVGIAGILEFGGGAMVAIGLYMRVVAFLLCGQMAVAYFMVHFAAGLQMPMGFFPVVNQGYLAILFSFVFLHLAAAGPGSFSVDAALSQRKCAAENSST